MARTLNSTFWNRAANAIFASLLLVSIAFGLYYYARIPSLLPSESDYRIASKEIIEASRPGDAVLLEPYWAERARLFFGSDREQLPVLNLGREPIQHDINRFKRIFLLSLPNLPNSTSEGASRLLDSANFRRLYPATKRGKLEWSVFENSALQSPEFDFTARISEAKVWIRRAGRDEECRFSPVDQRHRCPSANWIYVGQELKEIAFKPRRCLWAHPAGREPLVIDYSKVRLSNRLKVSCGIVGQIALRTEKYAPVELRINIDGNKIATISVPPGKANEVTKEFDTSQWAAAATDHQVTFEITATNPDMRHFCFDAGTYQ